MDHNSDLPLIVQQEVSILKKGIIELIQKHPNIKIQSETLALPIRLTDLTQKLYFQIGDPGINVADVQYRHGKKSVKFHVKYFPYSREVNKEKTITGYPSIHLIPLVEGWIKLVKEYYRSLFNSEMIMLLRLLSFETDFCRRNLGYKTPLNTLTYNQSLDLIICDLYKVKDTDLYVSISEVLSKYNLILPSEINREDFPRVLYERGFIDGKDVARTIFGKLTRDGVDFAEKNSFSQPATSLINLIHNLNNNTAQYTKAQQKDISMSKPQSPVKNKPRLFIGSSKEQVHIAYAIQANLDDDAECTVWDQNIFFLSSNGIDSLIKATKEFDFAIFVFTPDDITKMKGSTVSTVRDNVIFELGLFIGALSKDKVFFVVPQKEENFHILTDLNGVTHGTYNSERQDKNFRAALGPFSNQVREEMSKNK